MTATLTLREQWVARKTEKAPGCHPENSVILSKKYRLKARESFL